MEIPQYISVKEVRKVCQILEIRDWTKLEKPDVLLEESKRILIELDVQDLEINIEDFRLGLEVELEHGIRYPEANVTNNHPIITGKIVLAHLMESLDYYKRLEIIEIEGDLLKALNNKNASKVETLYRKLIKARLDLSQAEVESL